MPGLLSLVQLHPRGTEKKTEPVPLTFSSGGSQRGTQTSSGCVSAGERALGGKKGHAGLSEGSGLGGCLIAKKKGAWDLPVCPGLFAGKLQGAVPWLVVPEHPLPTLGTGASGTRAGLQSSWSVSVPGWH